MAGPEKLYGCAVPSVKFKQESQLSGVGGYSHGKELKAFVCFKFYVVYNLIVHLNLFCCVYSIRKASLICVFSRGSSKHMDWNGVSYIATIIDLATYRGAPEINITIAVGLEWRFGKSTCFSSELPGFEQTFFYRK